MRFIHFFIIIFLFFPLFTYSQTNLKRIPLSTFDFLLYPADAQSLSLGMGGFASNPNESNWANNQSKLPFLAENIGVNISYNPVARGLVSDMSLSRINAYSKLKTSGFINCGLQYFNGGTIDLRDDNGNSNGVFNSYMLAIQAGYSMRLGKKLSGCLTFRYVNAHLLPRQQFGQYTVQPSSTLNGDLSLFYQGDKTKQQYFNGAILIENIGPKVSFGDYKKNNFQSTIFRVGGTYNQKIQSNDLLSFNLDFHKMLVPTPPLINNEGKIIKGKSPVETSSLSALFSSWVDAPDGMKEEIAEMMFSIGATFNHADKLVGRIGYFNDPKQKGNRKLLTFGGGLQHIHLKGDKYQMNVDMAATVGLAGFTALNRTYMLTLNLSKIN
jgi:Type IX secretion system protein PorV